MLGYGKGGQCSSIACGRIEDGVNQLNTWISLQVAGRLLLSLHVYVVFVNVHIKGGDVRGHREVVGVISDSLVLWCIDPSRNGDTTRAMYHLLCLFRLAASKDIHEPKLPIIMHILLFSSRTLFCYQYYSTILQ